jgi:hypothetical protein
MRPLAVIGTALLIVIAGIGIGAGINRLLRPPPQMVEGITVVGPPAPVTIAQLKLNIPMAYFRGGQPPAMGMGERADLVIQYPTMAAAGMPAKTTASLASQNPRDLIFIAILRGDGILDPADRPQDLYGRFLERDTWQNPGGLLLRRFAADSPYADEELFIAPPDGRVFSARCPKPLARTELSLEGCIWRFRQSGADIQVRFSADLLPQWETMAFGIARLLEAWKAP